MFSNKGNTERSSAPLALIPIVIILLPLFYSVFSYVFAQGARTPQPFLEMPAPQYTECIRDTEYMRHHHWELLHSVREDVVRHGIRGDVTLNKCMECHTSRVNFCDRCHKAVSMTPDCYNCHYYP